MRQQLINWLIEDIAPEIRRSRDAEGEILKFARDRNLAAAQVQAMGQLYNTAKTLSFFDKSAARRGDPFPILDVDGLVDKYQSVEKKASIPHKFEYTDQDNGCGISLPDCFSGLTHTQVEFETPAPAQVFDNPVKRAAAERELTAVNLDFARQARFDYQEEMRKAACDIVTELRRNPTYPFDELEADALGIFGDDIKPIMTKLARFCQDDGWPVKRATAPSDNKLVMDPGGMIPMVEDILSNTFRIKAAEEMLQPSSEAAGSGPMLTTAPLIDKKSEDIQLKTPKVAAKGLIDPAEIEQRKQEEPTNPGTPAANTPGEDATGAGESPKAEGPDVTGGAGRSGKPPGRVSGSSSGGGKGGGKPLEVGAPGAVLEGASGWLDKLFAPAARNLPGTLLKSMAPRWNADQAKVDSDMRDAKHIATLQNLMTTDEILAEADPEQVVNIYNTIRNMAPQIAGDANVMRVFLRSAVQHDGIAPFDLKGLLDTEMSKQRVDENQRRLEDDRYGLKPPSLPAAKDGEQK